MNLLADTKMRGAAKGGASPGAGPEFRIVPVDDMVVWDALLDSHPLGSAQASAGWGVYKARLGHKVQRLTVVDRSDNIIAMALVATRSRFGIRVAHIAAGPLLFTESLSIGTRAIEALLGALARGVRDIVAVEPLLFGAPVLRHAVLGAGMKPVLSPGQHTLVVDLTDSEEGLRKQLRRAWRRRLCKADSNADLKAVFATGPAERSAALAVFERFYGELRRRKKFHSTFCPSAAHDVFRDDPRYVILEVRERDEPIAVFIAHRSQKSLTAFVGASSEAARSNSASYLGRWAQVNYARAEGLRTFDCGGIDPAGNPGVYQFKSGLTDNLVQTGPIWVHAKTRLMRTLAMLALANR